ncbi:MAG: hypothetical protein WCE68_09625 [Anaerolineales bacterium]
MTDFHTIPSAILENAQLRLEYLTTAGPRIVGLSYHGSPNLLADVPDVIWDTPNGSYFPLGGHRLWISPELPEKTYIPDGEGLSIQTIPGGVELTGAPERPSGVHKRVRIELEAGQARLHLVHTITNENPSAITIAPWVITMCRLGGTVILPQPTGNADPHGLLPNRRLVLWPYTRLQEARLRLRDDFILVHATPALPPVKLGYASNAGWLAYWNGGVLFRKSFDLYPGAAYPDGGCNAEVYCNDRAVELESLGELVTLAPGAAVQHSETWEVYPGLDVPWLPAEIRDLLENA